MITAMEAPGDKMDRSKLTVDCIVEMCDPERTGIEEIVLIESGMQSIVSTNSVMLWTIGHIPIVNIGAEDGHLKLWLDNQAVEEEWRRAIT